MVSAAKTNRDLRARRPGKNNKLSDWEIGYATSYKYFSGISTEFPDALIQLRPVVSFKNQFYLKLVGEN